MSTELNGPIKAYYAAEAAKDFAALADTFAADGSVRDEGRTFVGRAAIARWMEEAKAKYRHSSEVLAVEAGESDCRVTVRVSGTFPNSPVTLEQRFRLAQGQITALEIG